MKVGGSWPRPDELGIGRAIAACVAGGAWVGDPSRGKMGPSGGDQPQDQGGS